MASDRAACRLHAKAGIQIKTRTWADVCARTVIQRKEERRILAAEATILTYGNERTGISN